MHRGCISLGVIECDECHRNIPYPERYLIVEDEEGVKLHLCVDCSLKLGYAQQRKGERGLTFFVE